MGFYCKEAAAMRFANFLLTSAAFFVGLAVISVVSACVDRAAGLNCEQDAVCDLASGGVCTSSGTGNRWCSYPDTSCPGGYRYSDVQVGGGLSGVCVPVPDAMMSPPPPPIVDMRSCKDLQVTCGETGMESCCASPEVTGGMYFRSFDTDDYPPEAGDKNSPATVSSFRLDKFEVTVGRFRAFVAANQGTQANPPAPGSASHAAIPVSGWKQGWNSELPIDTADLVSTLKCDSKYQTWTDTPGSNENRPINCVTWFEAMAFCAWDGGYLPTETEWNYAAAGGSQQRPYPWSIPGPGPLVLDSSRASYATRNRDTAEAECYGDSEPACTVSDLVNVGTKPDGEGRWGQTDLSGNVNEWTLDTFAPYVTACTDCANLATGDNVTNRGGNFISITASDLRSGKRGFAVPGYVHYSNGLRCARPR